MRMSTNIADALRSVEARKAEPVVPAFRPFSTAMNAPQQTVWITFLADMDDSDCVRIQHDGVEKVLYATNSVAREIRRWAYRGRPLVGAQMRISYRKGNVRPDLDIMESKD